MTTALRRTTARLTVTVAATLTLTGAALSGAQAAQASTSCPNTPLNKTVDILLTFRDPLSADGLRTPTCR
ncbi:hypothetical protein [Kribbella swartbergensis]